VRKIKLRLDLIAITRDTTRRTNRLLPIRSGAEVVADLLRLIRLNFAGVAFLVSDADLGQSFNDLLGWYLQFSR
jgi:hypothetical protein